MGRWPARWPISAHLIGIGGAAMASIARLLAEEGVRVSGSDQAVYPPASQILEQAGITVRSPYAAANIDPRAELIVVGNAISRGNPELERVLDLGLPLASMPELIERLLIPDRRVTAVAGTHGKTTTTSMLAWLHQAAGREPGFVVGGLPGNFAVGARRGRGKDLILEADEYDSAFFDKGPKFLHYWPELVVLNAVEFDHADIYADIDAVERSFRLLLRMVPTGGAVIVNGDDARARGLCRDLPCTVLTFGDAEQADLRAEVERVDDRGQLLALRRGGRKIGVTHIPLVGEHNARNALAALLAFERAGGDLLEGGRWLEDFTPPRRRLELLGRRGDARVYDDFAHHPSAVAGTLAALRAMPGCGRLTACLEPRSNTMVRRLVQPDLLRALRGADRVLVAPVHRPERFSDEERLDVPALVADLQAAGVDADGPLDPQAIGDRILADLRPGDRVVLMSNGAFGGLAGRLREELA